MKKNLIFVLLVAVIAFNINSNPAEAASRQMARPGLVLEEFVFESSPFFRSCHSATVLELPSGELLCAFFSGTRESHPDVEIRLSRKPVGGEWTAPVSVADGNEPGGERMSTGNPVLFQERAGKVMLFYKVIKRDVGFLGRVKTSSDGGRTWSEPRKVGDGLMGAVKNKPIQLDNGNILSPSSTEDDHGWRVHIERSTDGGKTWKLIGPINPEAKIGAIQPTLMTYPDGRIQMLCRTRSEHGFIAQSWSEDGGLTWSPLEAAVLPNNNSGLDAVTLRDGRQLLVYNHSTRTQPGMGHKGRGILNVALSHNGIDWEAALVLEHLDERGKQFSYPSVIQTRDGLVHIVYTWHRQRIKHVVLDPKRLETTPMPDGKWPTDIEPGAKDGRPRVIVTSDGEIDDECSMVRFLLYANEWDLEAIITSSSQYHWQGHRWAGDDWIQPYLNAYAKVYPNLVKHDPRYPTPDYLRARTLLGNVKAEGEMDAVTAGSQYIVKVLLDEADDQPIWLQAWGGPNTIARALKTIEEEHPDQMAYVAKKIRFFFIWEQDSTYQDYIRPNWGKYNIPTIVSDQFVAIAYHWNRIIPSEKHKFFSGEWMKENILQNHGPLCSLYKAHKAGDKGFVEGDFRSEGDSPAFLHTIVTGLRSMESPDWGGWGGRYVKVRENTWLDPVQEPGYQYPKGRWYTSTAWGRNRMRKNTRNDQALYTYLKPMWRWADALQNDFAARADWCVKPYEQANHPPVVKMAHARDMKVRSGDRVSLSAKGATDPDGDELTYRWWQYKEADTYDGAIEIKSAGKKKASFTVTNDAVKGQTIHIICEVTDTGTPSLTRYQRVVLKVEN